MHLLRLVSRLVPDIFKSYLTSRVIFARVRNRLRNDKFPVLELHSHVLNPPTPWVSGWQFAQISIYSSVQIRLWLRKH